MNNESQPSDGITRMPHLTDNYGSRPPFLAALPPVVRDIAALAASDDELDMLTLGALVASSACLPHVTATYDRRVIHPHLYLFVVAPASAGKGCLSHCRDLVLPIHEQLLAESDMRGGLLIPANSSASAFQQRLAEQDGAGLIFETEGDTLSQALKLDNFSDLLRKAFQHEPISLNRRKNQECLFIDTPRLALLLSGTPAQVAGLIPTAENGLFSRFLFLSMNYSLDWRDVFATDAASRRPTQQTTRRQALRLRSLYESLRAAPPITFQLTDTQSAAFNDLFRTLQRDYARTYGHPIIPTVRRLGLIAFRLAMTLTTLRLLPEEAPNPDEKAITSEKPTPDKEPNPDKKSNPDKEPDPDEKTNPDEKANPDEEPAPGEGAPTHNTPTPPPHSIQPMPPTRLTCSDEDYRLATTIARTLVVHAAQVYLDLPRRLRERAIEEERRLTKGQQEFLEALPDRFGLAEAQRVAEAVGISDRSMFYYLKRFKESRLLSNEVYGHYEKRKKHPQPKPYPPNNKQ